MGMSILLRVLLVGGSLVVLLYVGRSVTKGRLRIGQTLFWVLFSLFLVIVSIVPELFRWLADILGVYSTTNLVFLIIIFLLLVKLLQVSLVVSRQQHQIDSFVQEQALKEFRDETASEDAGANASEEKSR